MKISVVTAVYNRKTTIAHALDSVAGQTYSNIEHVIQDGCSTDGTLGEIQHRDDPKLSIVSAPDSGIYDAINEGIRRASGDVIGLLHSDDFFADTQVLERVADVLTDGAIDGVYGDLDYVSAQDTARVVRKWRSGDFTHHKLKQGWMPPHPTMYLRREVYETLGTYDTDFQIAADYDAMLRYLVKGQIKLAYIPEVLVKMRVGGESNRSLARIIQKSREDYRAIRRNGVGGVGTVAMKNLTKLKQFF